MDRIVNVVKPADLNYGTYIICYKDNNGKLYEGCLNKEGYEVAMMKQKFIDLGYDMELIDEFEHLVYHKTYKDTVQDFSDG